MIIKYAPVFLEKLKKQDVRIRKSFKQRIDIFSQNLYSSQLNNHALRDEYEGYQSIDITNDWRALYEERVEGKDTIAYFVILGTHEQLYGLHN